MATMVAFVNGVAESSDFGSELISYLQHQSTFGMVSRAPPRCVACFTYIFHVVFFLSTILGS